MIIFLFKFWRGKSGSWSIKKWQLFLLKTWYYCQDCWKKQTVYILVYFAQVCFKIIPWYTSTSHCFISSCIILTELFGKSMHQSCIWIYCWIQLLRIIVKSIKVKIIDGACFVSVRLLTLNINTLMAQFLPIIEKKKEINL